MSNRLSCLGALAAFIVAAFLSPFSRVAGSKGKNFYLYDFCIMKCKMALLLSAFAFAPSVLSDVPVVTLSVENIQVRAEWRVVPHDNPDFRMDGNTLVFQSNIDGAGKLNGATIIATVEVLDKFSTLNPLYADLTTRVKITTVIMGCHGHETRWLAKAGLPNRSGLIAVRSGSIKVGDVIARRTEWAGIKYINLYTVSIVHHEYYYRGKNYISTSLNIHNHLGKYDQGNYDQIYIGYQPFDVNGGGNCFDKDIESVQEHNQNFQEQQEKIQYLNANAPPLNTGVFAGGVYAGDPNVEARVISVGTAFVLDSKQFFYLYNVTLANILRELYPIKIINDDGKAFSIDHSYQTGNYYEYYANLTVGSASVHGGKYSQPHEVIILSDSCPTRPPVSVIARKYTSSDGESLRLDSRPGEPSITELATYPYVLIDEVVYKFNIELTAASVGGGHILSGPLFDASSLSGVSHTIKFADHFLCESI